MKAKQNRYRGAPGDKFIWGTGAAVTGTVLMTLTLLLVIVVNGLSYFWPHSVEQVTLKDERVLLGPITGKETVELDEGQVKRLQIKRGNRDLYADFAWLDESEISKREKPEEAIVLERMEYGNFHGYLMDLQLAEDLIPAAAVSWEQFRTALKAVGKLQHAADEIEDRMAGLGRQMGKLNEKRLKLEYKLDRTDPAATAQVHTLESKIAAVDDETAQLNEDFETERQAFSAALQSIDRNTATFTEAGGREQSIVLRHIVRAYQPNAMHIPAKASFYVAKIGELLFDQPRESNTEGGLFPAIFGTVMMVIIMSLFCMPLGVVAAIYLREYAKDGVVVRMVRIAVNNLAGVPSIVYGVFGLGFFVYKVGGGLDALLYPHLEQPRLGTGGILWASMTLALLTLPVVIVSTEEALASIPRGLREGSLALGATKWQTIKKILLPMASPGILTGFILAMARAAGEVAPLMITGVVKIAPALPLDGQSPFLHLDRKFMHLGFHIYDVGFQSPNVEAAKPMVFVTTLLLLIIVVLLNLTAIRVRSKMRNKFSMGAF